MKITFVKNNSESCYWVMQGEECIDTIYIHYNFFDNSNYYVYNGKTYKRINELKKLIRASK